MEDKVNDRSQASRYQRLNITDFMTIGIFFVIITLVGTVVAFVGITPVTFVMVSSIQGLVLGIPTMLFYSKVKKPGMLLITAILSGTFSLLMALGPYHLIVGVLLALVAELILWSGQYKSARNSIIAYMLTSIAVTANHIPLFFATRSYILNSDMAGKYSEGMARGMTEIGERGFALYAVIVGATAVTSLLGGILGRKVFNKHFRRAGIV